MNWEAASSERSTERQACDSTLQAGLTRHGVKSDARAPRGSAYVRTRIGHAGSVESHILEQACRLDAWHARCFATCDGNGSRRCV